MPERLLQRAPYAESGSVDGDEETLLGLGDVVEVPLLLSGQQMLALEEAAHHRGLTAGEMVRQLLHEFIRTTLRCGVGS